jgi:hypothetical protein
MDSASTSAALTADKVVFRVGPHAGKRGTIAAVPGHDRLLIKLDEGGPSIETHARDIRNFSAAARKAWKTAPSRRVGRPAGRSVSRVSVTLRIDATLWHLFRTLESRALVQSRSEFFERALAEAI